jgi:hypothetical protein
MVAKMKMVRKLGLIVLLGLVLFALIQLIPYGRSHTNPKVVQEPNWDTATRAIAKKACFDCHSNAVTWPWYSNIAPASWLVQRDVDEGRRRLNFSDWGRAGSETGEFAEVIQGGDMPPFQYTLIHTSARLTAAEKQTLIQSLGK